jgi:murein L,D-transpeptidase YcbB/YkuD
MAEFQRLSQLDSGVLRANRIRSSLGARVATAVAGRLADRTLQECVEKWLRPDDYDSSRWEQRIRALQTSAVGAAVARFDVALTVCTMRYVSDLRVGRVNPKHFKFGLDVEHKKYDLAQFLRNQILTLRICSQSSTRLNLHLRATAAQSRRSRGTSNWLAPTMGKSFPPLRSLSNRASHTRECPA